MKTVLLTCCVLLFSFAAWAQTFEVDGQQSQPANSSNAKQKKGQASNTAGDNGIGWGSSIEVSRLARAAEDALRRGNPSAAADYAERAVKAAPQDNKLWFLLGYTSRLAGRYQTSVEAYQHGLQTAPGNADGLSGLAQTYERMGRTDDAKRLLLQVIRANPKRTNDLLVLGELDMRTGDTQEGINLLQRAESQQPNAHAELMLAVAYLKLKQPDRAKQMLDMAKKHSPNNVEIFQAAANYYREEHDYKAAIMTLKSAPHLTPSVLADLGYTYELDGDKEQAAEAYTRAANEKPKEIGYQLSAAQAQLRVGNMDKAHLYLNRAATLDANHYRLHAIRALLAKEENRQADAIAEYKAAIAAMPSAGVPEGQLYPIQLRLNLAELYRESGDDEAAHQQIATAEQEINKLDVQGTAKAEFLRVRASLKISDNDLEGRGSRPDRSPQARSRQRQHQAGVRQPAVEGRPQGRVAQDLQRCAGRRSEQPLRAGSHGLPVSRGRQRADGSRVFQPAGQGLSRRLHPLSRVSATSTRRPRNIRAPTPSISRRTSSRRRIRSSSPTPPMRRSKRSRSSWPASG